MWREELAARVRAFEHPAWGWEHSLRLLVLADEIAGPEKLGLDDDVMFAAAMVHDLGMFYGLPGVPAAEAGARAAETMLAEVGFPAEKIETIATIVRENGFTGETRDTPEARVLRDADMLEFLGAVGVTRLLAIVGLEDWIPTPKDAIDQALAFAEDLPPKMLHKTSREMAERRAQETRDFVSALSRETGALAVV